MNRYAISLLLVFGFLVVPQADVLAAVSGRTIQLANPGFEVQEPGSSQKAASWREYKVGNGYVRTNEEAHSGQWSVKITSNTRATLYGATQRINLNQTTAKPVLISGYVKGVGINPEPGSFFGASLYIGVFLKDGTQVFWNSLANNGTFDWRWIGLNTASGFSTTNGTIKIDKPISYIEVTPMLGNAIGRAYFDDITVQEFTSTEPVITLMFDDGNASDFAIAKPIFDTYGFRGTTAIITNYAGKPGYVSYRQIKNLVEAGWEVVSHTVTHRQLPSLSEEELDTELRESKARLQGHDLIINHIAVPFGAHNSNVLSAASQYYNSVRTYEAGYNPVGSFPYQIKTQSIIFSTTPQDVQAWIDDAKTHGAWLVITTHLIADQGPNKYYVTKERFEEIMKVVAQSGVKVVTYDEGFKAFAATSPVIPQEVPSEQISPLTVYDIHPVLLIVGILIAVYLLFKIVKLFRR